MISGVTLDSRAAARGELFAALPGHETHGAHFADAAISSGATAILTDAEGARIIGATDVPVLVVIDPRSWLGGVAALVHGYPGSAMQIIGITGTNGKTTVAAMVEAGLRESGVHTGVIGTLGVRIADQSYEGTRTTPEATDLHALLAVMRDHGVTSVVMEVSSIAIEEKRVNGVIYDIAAFTNLSQDHLDYHGSMERYFVAKSMLFHPVRSRQAVIGVDDAWGKQLAENCLIPVDTWSTDGAVADWMVRVDESVVDGPDGARFELDTPLPGRFNLANALCALVILLRAGVSRNDALRGIAATTVPGRMQVVGVVGGVRGVIDYAHSPDAIERVLAVIAAETTGRVIAVIGAGGDRDRTKREEMGQIASRLADVVVITDDNPRSEDPAAIRAALRAGALSVGRRADAEVVEEADRALAITVAVATSRAGDCVVVLGKGHEQGQEVAGVITPFDDASVLSDALRNRSAP